MLVYKSIYIEPAGGREHRLEHTKPRIHAHSHTARTHASSDPHT